MRMSGLAKAAAGISSIWFMTSGMAACEREYVLVHHIGAGNHRGYARWVRKVLASELERRCVAEVDGTAGVLADVLGLGKRVFEGGRPIARPSPIFLPLASRRDGATLSHAPTVVSEVHGQRHLLAPA